jgi:hypothetical protein
MPDCAEDCDVLEALDARGVPTGGPDTEAEARRLRGLVDDHMPEEISERPIDLAIVPHDRPEVASAVRRAAANRRVLRRPGGGMLPIVDLRRGDRRADPSPSTPASPRPERRQGDRRSPPPAAWQPQGLVIVPGSDVGPSAGAGGAAGGASSGPRDDADPPGDDDPQGHP